MRSLHSVVVLFAAAALIAASLFAGHGTALDNGVARLPPMGWSSWNTFACNVSESLIKEIADTMVSTGLAAAGYEYVNIDDCWMRCTNRTSDSCNSPQDGRDPVTGEILADPIRFPSGMKALADYIHSKGLKFGMYTSSGNVSCSNFMGSWQNEKIDALTFASWDVDFLKMDCCSTTKEMKDVAYPAMSDALNQTGRPILFSCDTDELFANPLDALKSGERPYAWAPAKCNMWRTSGDIKDIWFRVMLNLDLNDVWWDATEMWKYAGYGAWNDADMLVVGMGKLDFEQYKSHFFLWSLMSSPLILGNDIRSMSNATLSLLTSPEVIAVNQDALGLQGHRLGTSTVWRKTVVGGVAVVLFNRDDFSQPLCVDWNDLGVGASIALRVRDLYERVDLGVHTAKYCTPAALPAFGSVMLKFTQL